jgi:tripartite-type tricarboxylate transporter receptor subunit TctC
MICAGALLCASTLLASAQLAYPGRPIRIIAPVQPGGGVDLVARTMADGLSAALGVPVFVDNQGAGGGIVASVATARAAADGYTLMVGYVGTHGTNPAVRKLPYDPIGDFTPIAMVGGTPNVFIVPMDVPSSSLHEFVEYAKSNPGKLAYGSGGAGTLVRLAMEQFKLVTNLDMVHVAYRGVGAAFPDLFGGRIHAMLPGLAAALPHIKANRVKALAVTGARRHPLLPDVPTFRELGYPEFDGVQWYGIVGPANLPLSTVKRLNEAIVKMLDEPELRNRLSSEALEPMPMTPDQFGRYMTADIAHWTTLVKQQKLDFQD